MKSFKLIQELVRSGKIEPLADTYPVGFSIMSGGKILLTFTNVCRFMNFDSFEDLDNYITDFMLEDFGDRFDASRLNHHTNIFK